MENTNEKVSKNGVLNPNHIPAAQNESVKTPGNESFEHSKNDPNEHKGSEDLAAKYNIGDKAHTDSSAANFVKTISNSNHANSSENNDENEFLKDSRNHS